MSKPILNVSERDRAQCLRHRIHQSFERPSLRRPQSGFDFRPAQFNRVEVRRIGWQEFQVRAMRFNQLADRLAGMSGQVIQHHDVTSAQGREQLSTHIRFRCATIHGAFKNPRGGDLLPPQRGDEGGMGARIARRGFDDSLAGRVNPRCAPLSSRNFKRLTSSPKGSTNCVWKSCRKAFTRGVSR